VDLTREDVELMMKALGKVGRENFKVDQTPEERAEFDRALNTWLQIRDFLKENPQLEDRIQMIGDIPGGEIGKVEGQKLEVEEEND